MNEKVLDETPPWALPLTTAVVPLDKTQNLHLPERCVVSLLLCAAEITVKICKERTRTCVCKRNTRSGKVVKWAVAHVCVTPEGR